MFGRKRRMSTAAWPARASRRVQIRQRGLAGDEQRKGIGELVGRLVLAGPAVARQPRVLGVEAHQPRRAADHVAEPGIGDLALGDGGNRVVPHAHLDHVALGLERHLQLQHARRLQAQAAIGQARVDHRQRRHLALRQELAVGIDHQPFTVADAVDLKARGGQRRFRQRDAAAALDRIQKELGDGRVHGRAVYAGACRVDAAARLPQLRPVGMPRRPSQAIECRARPRRKLPPEQPL
jgi:hypothetical protein